MSMFQVILIGPIIFAPVSPRIYPLPMHQIFLPIALVASPVLPLILSKAVNLVGEPLAFIFISFCPDIHAISFFPPVHIIAVVARVFGPVCLALAMLDVITPHAFEFGAVAARVDAKAIALVRFKLAFVHVSISVPESAPPFGLVVGPVAFVAGPVRPYLDAEAVADPLFT